MSLTIGREALAARQASSGIAECGELAARLPGDSASRSLASRRGFTLVEVLVSVFFGAAILVMATSFVFSLGMLWGEGAETWLFKKHVRGVSRFLQQSVDRASMRLGSADTPQPVRWASPGGLGNATVQLLSFELDKSPGVLVWGEGDPLPYVVCFLQYEEDEGLSLLWGSRLEERFGDEEPRSTLISEFVKGFRYLYLDASDEDAEWEALEEPKKETTGEFIVPQRLELVFRYEGEEHTRQIVLPATFNGVPIF